MDTPKSTVPGGVHSVERLRVCRIDGGRHVLLHQECAIGEANAFLEAIEMRGLSRQTIRAYAYDLLLLYRWLLESMAVTADCYVLPAVVVVHDKRMKEPWCLATNRSDLKAAEIVKLYGKRFRDTKDIHFGMGLKATHIDDSSRRDRLLLLGAMAHALLSLLGAAGERAGMDRMLKVNTSKQRQHSLYNQGSFWYDALPNMPTIASPRC